MDSMAFPKTAYEFIEQYSFKDEKQEYTNGAVLIPVFRVKQMVEHYFPVEVVRCKDCKNRYTEDCLMLFSYYSDAPDADPEGVSREWTEDNGFCFRGERRER